MLVRVINGKGGYKVGEVIDIAHAQAREWIKTGAVVAVVEGAPLPVEPPAPEPGPLPWDEDDIG